MVNKRTAFLRDQVFLFATILPVLTALVLAASDWSTPSINWLLATEHRLIWLILIVPVVEELAFRGFLQTTLMKRLPLGSPLPGLSYANILTSLVFMMLHLLMNPQTEAFLTILPSLIFGLMRERAGSVIPAILLHILYNALSLTGCFDI